MSETPSQRILARHRTADLVGRKEHVERLLTIAQSDRRPSGCALLAAPGAGASELLRHVFDRLFTEQESVVPFYFELKPTDRTAQTASLRFLCEFLIQTVAFRRRDASIISASPAMAEIAELSAPIDGHWIGRLVDNIHSEAGNPVERSFIRNCLGAPVRARANGSSTFVMIDGVHMTAEMEGGEAWLDDAVELLSGSDVPFVVAGWRRSLFARTTLDTISLAPFTFREAGSYIESLAAAMHVQVNDQTRDLLAVQLSGNASHTAALMSAAAASGRDMLNFEQVQQVYTDEIFGGRIGRSLDDALSRIARDPAAKKTILEILSELYSSSDGRMSVDRFTGDEQMADPGRVLRSLHEHEFAGISAGHLEFDPSNIVVRDVVDAGARLEVRDEQRALVVGDALTSNVKRAPLLMARHYRRSSAIGIRQILSLFDGRGIPPGLIDYSTFRSELKGSSDVEILQALKGDSEAIKLPRIVYTADTTAFYPPLREIVEAERSAVALGFTGPGEENQVVWLAAEIDSKLEAPAQLAEFWCDRLEMAAVNCDFRSYRIWLVAPEGFEEGAIKVLDDRNAFGSSRRQAELLRRTLEPAYDEPNAPATEYEFTVPMGHDTELIAAHAVEEIAKRHNFSAKAINQIKTAVVEACINAVEHSLSPDRKIYQKFSVDAEKLSVTIANRGLRITDKKPAPGVADTGRRGWGLKLMRGLMDEVAIEQTDDGTRITMIKYLATHTADPKS